MRTLAAFVPVDDEHTLLHLRLCLKLLTIPVLGKLVARLAMPSNVYIAHEDLRKRKEFIHFSQKQSGVYDCSRLTV